MNYRRRANCTRRYLNRFDEILEQMAGKMLEEEPINDITKYFIECMIPHHQAAVYMCENLLQYTTYKPLQEIARQIIEIQTQGIEQMKEIDITTGGFFNYPRQIQEYKGQYLEITRNMLKEMKNSPRCMYINLDFIGEMIPHHEGAIKMCENLLQYYIDPRLRIVVDAIIKEQCQGVKELEEIRKKLC